MIGDNGVIEYTDGAAVRLSTNDSEAGTTGTDTIIVSDGNNRVLAGLSGDSVTSTHGVDVVLGDNGELSYANNILIKAVSSETTLGGIDVLNLGDGDNVVIAGHADDSVAVGNDNDTVIGDNGEINYSLAGVITDIQSTATDQGGDDEITITGGNNTVIAGFGNDEITTGDGADFISGDNIKLTFSSLGKLSSALSISPSDAGDDTINAVNGDNIIVAGSGVDIVTTGNDYDIIFGDNAKLTFIEQGQSSELLSSELNFGDVDSINAGDGRNIIAGGRASDDITSGSGVDFVSGDNIIIKLVKDSPIMMTPVDDLGGDDVITLGPGSAYVIAGPGDDKVTNQSGDSVMIGDQGLINFAENGLYRSANTGDINIIGNDVLVGGSDSDVIFGGAGSDEILGNSGSDFLMGDAGRIMRDDLIITFESIDLFTGDDDFISAGPDIDYAFGGFGHDLFSGTFANDTMTGEYARIRLSINNDLSVSGVETFISLAQGKLDLIRITQNDLYTGDSATHLSNMAVKFNPSIADTGLRLTENKFEDSAHADFLPWPSFDIETFLKSHIATSKSDITTKKYFPDPTQLCDEAISDQCEPIDLEALCESLNFSSTGLPEACLPSEKSSGEQSVNTGESLSSSEQGADVPLSGEHLVAGLGSWAAISQKSRMVSGQFDRTSLDLVAAKAKAKKFMSWRYFEK